MVPSQYPSISFLPSLSSVPTEGPCFNYDGWFDIYGDDCTYYENYDEPGCPNEGEITSDEGISALQACCKYFYVQLIFLFFD